MKSNAIAKNTVQASTKARARKPSAPVKNPKGAPVTAAKRHKEDPAAEAKANAQAVIKVVGALGQATTVVQCVSVALESVRDAFGWAYGSFWRFSPKTNDLRFAYESGVVNPEFHAVTKEARFTEGVGLSGRTWKTQDLYFVADLGTMKDCCRAPAAQKAGVKSGVCFPVFSSGSFLGTMDFFALETLQLSEERLNVLRSVGRLVSSAIDRTLVEEKRAATAEDTLAVNKVLETVTKAKNSAEAVRFALDTVRSSFNWAYGSYWELDGNHNELRFAVESGVVNGDFREVTLKARFREGEGLSGRAWKNRELFFVSDIGTMKDCCRAPSAQKAGVKSGICFPILDGAKVLGTMDFFALEELEPSEERLEALRSVGRLVSSALSAIAATERQRTTAQDAIAVNRVLEVVGKARTAEDTVRSVLETVKAAFGWAYGSYWKLDTKSRELAFSAESGVVNEAFRKVTMEARFPEGVGLSGRTWATRDLFFVEDLGEMKDCCRAPSAQQAGVKSGICFPILMEGEVIGTMDFFSTEKLTLSQERLDSLRNVGRLVSSALERIYNLERKVEDTRAVNSVLEMVGRVTMPDDAARLALETVRGAFGWAYGSYWKIDSKAQKLKFALEAGSVNEEFRRVTMDARFQEGEGLSGRAWRGRDLFFVQDLGTMKDCCRAPVAQRAGVKSGVAMPITMAGEVVGTMDFFALETLTLSQERLEALRSIGRLVSSAFERLDELQRSARNAESLSGIIGNVTQNASSLTSSSLELTNLSQQMARNADETASQANVVSAASEQVSQNIAVVASGAKEMLASIQEISRSSSEAARVAHNAVSMADSANQTVSKLGDASNEIGQVIKVITSIAQQTNLLALNATIEAARAGEAGKGFAVVANEVKELAKQTASATEEIGRKIEAIQLNTRSAIDVIANIGTIINQVSDISNTIATAVEEQTATTNEIGRNVSEAARGASEIAKNITGVAGSAQSTAEGSERSLHAANAVQQMATQLSELVAQQAL